MEKQKLKWYLRSYGCTIVSHSLGETFREAGNFILGKWESTTFVVESIEGGGLMLRVTLQAGWNSYFSPCRACSRFMGTNVTAEKLVGWMPIEQCFIWTPNPDNH